MIIKVMFRKRFDWRWKMRLLPRSQNLNDVATKKMDLKVPTNHHLAVAEMIHNLKTYRNRFTQTTLKKRLLYPINDSPRISDSIRDCCHGTRTVPWNCVQLTHCRQGVCDRECRLRTV